MTSSLIMTPLVVPLADGDTQLSYTLIAENDIFIDNFVQD